MWWRIENFKSYHLGVVVACNAVSAILLFQLVAVNVLVWSVLWLFFFNRFNIFHFVTRSHITLYSRLGLTNDEESNTCWNIASYVKILITITSAFFNTLCMCSVKLLLWEFPNLSQIKSHYPNNNNKSMNDQNHFQYIGTFFVSSANIYTV